jgi:hypothetical protein
LVLGTSDLRRSYSGVTVVSHWFYSGVTEVLQWCYGGAGQGGNEGLNHYRYEVGGFIDMLCANQESDRCDGSACDLLSPCLRSGV